MDLRDVSAFTKTDVMLDVDKVFAVYGDESGPGSGVFFVCFKDGTVSHLFGLPGVVAADMTAELIALDGRCCAELIESVRCVAPDGKDNPSGPEDGDPT